MDTSNQYHLWVIADPTIGLATGMHQPRLVLRPGEGLFGDKTKQRAFEPGQKDW